MRNHIYVILALAAALCACTKEQMIEPEITQPVEPSAQLVFTATMESTPGTKATIDDRTPSWEVGDQISINGFLYSANTAGASSNFNTIPSEIRPKFVSSTNTGSYKNQPAQNLVDDQGVDTRWISKKDQRVGGVWNIVVTTGVATQLKSIKLWNADNQTYPGRRWKDAKISGSSSADRDWEDILSLQNMNLNINNRGLAGEAIVNASSGYTYYKIDVYDNMGDDYMQMSDMKFVVTPSASDVYDAYFPASLCNDGKALLPSQIAEQWVDGKFNMPMYAHSEDTNLQFKNLCGVLKICVKKDQISAVKRIRVSSNQSLSGYFTVENDGAKLSDGTGDVTITYDEAVATTAEGRIFYIAVPPQTYDYLKIELDADGSGFTKVITTKQGYSIVVDRNKIYPVNQAYDSAISVSVTNEVDGQVMRNLIMKNTSGQKIYLRSMIVAAWYDKFGNIAVPCDIMSQGTFENLAPAGWTNKDGLYYYDSAVDSEGCPAAPLFSSYTKASAPAAGLHLEMNVMVQAIPYDSTVSCVDAFERLK